MLNNYVEAIGDAIFSNYSHAPLATVVDADTQAIVENGTTLANAEAEAFFTTDLAGLFTESSGFGLEGAFQGSASSEAQIIASFDLEAGETLSFDFLVDLQLEAKEIDNPDIAYNEAKSNISLLILDTSEPNRAEVIDYAGVSSHLISSEQIARLEVGKSDNFTVTDKNKTIDIDGDNGTDFISATGIGTYQKTFDDDTDLIILKVNQSEARWLGDADIGNLGPDFIYGTIWDDRLKGTKGADKIYASIGDDLVSGKKGDDGLIGGLGEDTLMGGRGKDTISGGDDDDTIIGGAGSDSLSGEAGDDLIFGGLRADTVSGGEDDDTIMGDSGSDSLSGEAGDDSLVGGSGADTLLGGDGDDTLIGGSGRDKLNGGKGNDRLIGGSGADTLSGDAGDDVLIGGTRPDRFIYDTSRSFSSEDIGVDQLLNFDVGTDKIVLSLTTFTALSSTSDGKLKADEFEAVADDNLAATSDAFITYSTGTGNLFYNQNGAGDGFGDGAQFATLEAIPGLTATDFVIV